MSALQRAADETPTAACEGRWDAWDLDVIGHDPVAVQSAVEECRRCSIFYQCQKRTAEGKRPVGVVQAGRVFREPGRSYSGRGNHGPRGEAA